MTAKQIVATDEMLCRMLRAYLEEQARIYFDNMPVTDNVMDSKLVNEVQSRYEVASLALSTVARFALRLGAKDQFPYNWSAAVGKVHDLICEAGDKWLHQHGIDPSQF